jgi:hypothetical protein
LRRWLGAHDVRLDQQVVRAADHDQVLDRVAAHDDEAALPVDGRDVQDSEAIPPAHILALQVPRPEAAQEEHDHGDERDDGDEREDEPRCERHLIAEYRFETHFPAPAHRISDGSRAHLLNRTAGPG